MVDGAYDWVLFDLGGVLVRLGGDGSLEALCGLRGEAFWARWLTCPWVRDFERGDEVVAAREPLRRLAASESLTGARVDPAGTVIVHSEAPGYGPLRRFAAAASGVVGVWVNVITDDVPAAEVR
ncbi:MAG: hypothetical protein ACRD0J_00290, partial [Acidimicrobiales bacterium]